MAFYSLKSILLCLVALQFASASTSPTIFEPLTPIELTSADGSIKASFIPSGAAMTSFWVKDRDGTFRDIALGFDDTSLYQSGAKGRSYFGSIVGRYANRIRNGTFTIPISKNATGPGQKYYLPRNSGNNTLFGGPVGFDLRNFTVAHSSAHSLTLTMIDPAGMEGFPGQVNTTVTYSLLPHATFSMKIHATASEDTPIMLSAHHNWNLEAYKESENLNGHHIQIRSSKYVETDVSLLPDGNYAPVQDNPMDFRTSKSVGLSIPSTAAGAYCGAGCVGYDNCWVFDSHSLSDPSFSVWNNNSGIKMDIYTNQRATQMSTCNTVYNASNPIPRKLSQGGPDKFYSFQSCIVVEPQDIIDAINNPEYGVDQIYGPGRDYKWDSLYKFSTVNSDGSPVY